MAEIKQKTKSDVDSYRVSYAPMHVISGSLVCSRISTD